MKKLLLGLVLLFPLVAVAQGGGRYDSYALTVSGVNVIIIPNVKITVCTAAATGTPCAPLATTYTDQTLTTPCAGSTQVVLQGGSVCQANGDPFGNFGFWASPGTYKYQISKTGFATQTFTITVPADATNVGPIMPPTVTSTCPNPATTGFIRMCKTDQVNWRNNANSGDQGVSQDASDRFLISQAGGLELNGSTPDLLLGGTTASFPRLVRNGANVDVKKADLSAFAFLTGDELVGNTAVTIGAVRVHGTASSGQAPVATSASDAQWANILAVSGFTQSMGTSGYIKFPASLGGLLLQWNIGPTRGNSEGTDTTTMPQTCATQVDNVQVTYVKEVPGAAADDAWYQVDSTTTSTVVTYKQSTGGTSANSHPFVFMICH